MSVPYNGIRANLHFLKIQPTDIARSRPSVRRKSSLRPVRAAPSKAGFRGLDAVAHGIGLCDEYPSIYGSGAAVMLGFKQFRNAAVTIAGVELIHRVRKGQFGLRRLGVRGRAAPAVWNAVLGA